MLTYNLTPHHSEPLYQQLYLALKNDITSVKLLGHEKLPSKRKLAKHLGVSVTTVDTAYQQLIAEGYLYSKPNSGFFISDIQHLLTSTDTPIRPVFHKTTSPVMDNTLLVPAKPYQHQQDFPFSVWSKLLKQVLNQESHKLLEPAPSGGVLELKEAIAQHLYDFRGMLVSPEQIIIGAGTEYLYSLISQLFGSKHHIAVEDPSYSRIAKVYNSHQIPLSHLPIIPSGIDLADLEHSRADILHLSPSHQFPTGQVLPVNKRYQLLGWASQADNRYIIEDDYDSEFRFKHRPIPSLKEIDQSNKVIYMNTFSRSLLTTLRIAYMILPPKLLTDFHDKLGFYSPTVSNLEQYTLARFISQGYFERHLNRMRLKYQKKLDCCHQTIKKSPLKDKIVIKEDHSGLHFILAIATELDENVLIDNCHHYGILLSPLSEFAHNKTSVPENHFVIQYANMTSEEFGRLVTILEKVL
ncbi:MULTISPECIES: MocR-like pyridoxine biosynthesis transcription factor PdxR [Streptococcus]|uniref:PLP-dependent aminotransferase family protein n=1 Tax=Streptococcus caledonicus TaxID=2614158 RepID=A0ABW0UC07_9STRE|nr:PLP-dependent aminotransferase family protein [Streptococcus sp. S784/96/1]